MTSFFYNVKGSFVTDLVMETRAHLRAVHPAVAGQEAAALAEREAVDGVVTEELLPAGRHQGHASARLVLV